MKYFPEKEIYDMQKYQIALSHQKITREDEIKKYNGKLYYKDPNQYYGPMQTYKDIPDLGPSKFYVRNQFNKIVQGLFIVLLIIFEL